ncbi:glycoside hydrolase family 18 protein [Cysteiniphilum litorale]|uniref:glycoside hydrolase family 18 protein n=1 Tax=Cysteiniphilum litorale TaxID=2056700 RepID=UPI003F885384
MKKLLPLVLGSMIATSVFAANLQSATSDKVIAGYLDVTATGSALKVNMNQAVKDGYNMVIFGFAKVNGTKVSSYNESANTVTKEKLDQAHTAGMKTLISFGGQNNTFEPGELNATQVQELAQNMVSFVKDNGFDGIDFDLEVEINPVMLRDLLQDIKNIDSNIILSAAPQINNGRFVTHDSYEGYRDAIASGLFNYLFIQEYNTAPQNEVSFISSSYQTLKQQVPATTKLVIGEPTASVAAGTMSIYHPTADKTLTTPEATASMLPELKKINQDAQYGGVMGWSLNVDYSPADYAAPNHVPGSYAYGLKDCVYNNQCDTAPTPKPDVPNYTLQVSNLDAKVGITFHIVSVNGDQFTSDYTAPKSNHVYNATTAVSAANIEGKTKLMVHVDSYAGGPSFTCPQTFDLTHNTNVMVNITTKACDIAKLP